MLKIVNWMSVRLRGIYLIFTKKDYHMWCTNSGMFPKEKCITAIFLYEDKVCYDLDAKNIPQETINTVRRLLIKWEEENAKN